MLTDDNQEKSAILQERFFPGAVEANLSDTTIEHPPKRTPVSSPGVTPEEVEVILRNLPSGKTQGPYEIPNEILQALFPEWKNELADAISTLLSNIIIPSSFKESITITFRKERRPDYSIPSSYRPIALENSLDKLVEKIVANRISKAAEEYGMLP